MKLSRLLLLAIAALPLAAIGAQQTINVGSSPGDGTGDTLRAAMQKSNANFSELYSGKQPLDTELTCLAGVTSAADRLFYFDGSGTCALAVFPSFGRSLAALSSAAALRSLADLEIGVDVQAYDADLDTWSSKVPPSGTVVGTTDVQSLSNKTLTAPVVNSPTGIVKGDVGLGNVDNVSNATERAAAATLTNKVIDCSANTCSNVPDAALSANVPRLNSASLLWTAIPTWSSSEVRVYLNESDQTTDEKLWRWQIDAKVLRLQTRTDADGAGVDLCIWTRGTGTALTNMQCGNATNNPSFLWLGTGTALFGGRVQGNTFEPQATTTTGVAAGINRPGTNRLGFVSNATLRGEFDANGQFKIAAIGRGISLPEGSNAKMGTCTLVAGTCTVSTTAVTATSRIMLTSQADGGTPDYVRVSSRTAATSFVITSGSGADTSTIAWIIFEPS